jgi:hypothetical protein
MSRSCEKLGCNEPGEVAFGIDRITCVVWLENYDPDDARHLNVLCNMHASRLTLPRGWSFDDRRERVPRLFVAPKPTANVTANKPVKTRDATASTRRTTNKSTPAPGRTRKTGTSGNKTGALPRRTARDTSKPVKRMDGPGLFDPTLPMNSPHLKPLPGDATATNGVPRENDATATTGVPRTASADTQQVHQPTHQPDYQPDYQPKFDRTSDVGGALNATGRLLKRAFSSQTKPIERPQVGSNTDSLPQGDHIDDFNQGDHVE